MQYCTIAFEQWRKVWSIAVLHFIVVIIGSEYCSIAVLERGLQYCIGERFGVAVSSDQREPMLPSRRILCKLPCAFSHLLHTLYRSIVSSWIRGPGLSWRHCRIPAGIPASVTPSRALCPPSLACPRSPRSQAFRPKEWSWIPSEHT